MTEHEAWLKLGRVFARVARGETGDPTLSSGLCYQMEALALSLRQRLSMLSKINTGGLLYRWPLTIEGARERASFCRRQAAKLRRER